MIQIDMRFRRWWRQNAEVDEVIGLSHWVEYQKQCKPMLEVTK